MKLLKLLSVLGVALILSFTSIAQTASKDVAMEKFDIEAFNMNKQGHDWSYTEPDGTSVRQWQTSKKEYQIEITPANSAYTTVKVYNEEGSLDYVWYKFYNFSYGTSKEYDGHGNVIKEYNDDVGFAFSVDDLIKKMKEEYHVDITDKRQVFTVRRGLITIDEQKKPLYILYIYDFSRGINTSHTIAYLFDGNTGELLYTIPADIEGSPSILREYKIMLQNKKANNQ